MPMLNLTYVAQGAAVSRLSRVSSPATQLRFGAVLLRPGRTAAVQDHALKPHLDSVCDAMARGVLVVRSGARNLDAAELRSLVVSGSMPAGNSQAALPAALAQAVEAVQKAAEPEAAAPAEEPPAPETAPAEEPAAEAVEAPAAETPTTVDASRKKKGR